MHREINGVRRFIMRFLTSKISHCVSNRDISLLKNSPIKRILIIRPNSRLGNQLLLTPLIQEISTVFPQCKLDIFVRGNLAPVLYKNYSNIDQIIKLPPKPFKQLLAYIKVWFSLSKRRYDLVINADVNSSSGRIATNLCRSKIKFYNCFNPEKLKQVPDYEHMGKGAVYNLRDFLGRGGYLTGERPIPVLSLRLSQTELSNGALKLREIAQTNKPVICIYTFATGTKCYPKYWWRELYSRIKRTYEDHFSILEVLPKENVSQIDFSAPTYYSTDIREMGAVISQSAIFISADCGIMHLASSAGTPTVGLFSTTKIDIYAPYNPGSIAIDTTRTSIEEIMVHIHKILTPYCSGGLPCHPHFTNYFSFL